MPAWWSGIGRMWIIYCRERLVAQGRSASARPSGSGAHSRTANSNRCGLEGLARYQWENPAP